MNNNFKLYNILPPVQRLKGKNTTKCFFQFIYPVVIEAG
jgi:hypothetical protein